MSEKISSDYSKDCVNNEKVFKFYETPLFRQIFICLGPWNVYFTNGLCVGTPTVMFPQLEEEGILIQDHIKAWISSVFGLAGSFGLLILPSLTRLIGIKKAFLLCYLVMTIAMLVFTFSRNGEMILLAMSLHSFATFSAAMSLNLIIISEYTNPEYRGILMAMKAGSLLFGVWVANALGTFYYWRSIHILSLVCNCYMLLIFVWPESPYWLAKKGRFDECRQSFRWLRGCGNDSERELSDLILNVINKRNTKRSKEETGVKKRISSIKSMVLQAEFYKPLVIGMFCSCIYNFTGKWACNVFAIEMLIKLTNNKKIAYNYMLILDAVTLICVYLGCYLAKILKRRTMLFIFTSVGCIFSFLISIYVFLLKSNYIEENNLLCLVLLLTMTVSLSLGPLTQSMTLIAELIPHKFNRAYVTLVGLFHLTFFTIMLRVSSFIFNVYGVHLAFFLYSMLGAVFLLLLFKYLPETKDKTLIEIKNYFVKKELNNSNERDVLMA